jgi:hypothetical protein
VDADVGERSELADQLLHVDACTAVDVGRPFTGEDPYAQHVRQPRGDRHPLGRGSGKHVDPPPATPYTPGGPGLL